MASMGERKIAKRGRGRPPKRPRNNKAHSSSNIQSRAIGKDGYFYFCVICDEVGSLLCCDGCSCVYHLGCLTPPLEVEPEGDWFCPNCSNNNMGKYPASTEAGTSNNLEIIVSKKKGSETSSTCSLCSKTKTMLVLDENVTDFMSLPLLIKDKPKSPARGEQTNQQIVPVNTEQNQVQEHYSGYLLRERRPKEKKQVLRKRRSSRVQNTTSPNNNDVSNVRIEAQDHSQTQPLNSSPMTLADEPELVDDAIGTNVHGSLETLEGQQHILPLKGASSSSSSAATWSENELDALKMLLEHKTPEQIWQRLTQEHLKLVPSSFIRDLPMPPLAPSSSSSSQHHHHHESPAQSSSSPMIVAPRAICPPPPPLPHVALRSAFGPYVHRQTQTQTQIETAQNKTSSSSSPALPPPPPPPPLSSSLLLSSSSSSRGLVAPPHLRRNLPNHDGGDYNNSYRPSHIQTLTQTHTRVETLSLSSPAPPPPSSLFMLPPSSSRGSMAPPHLRRNLPNNDGGEYNNIYRPSLTQTQTRIETVSLSSPAPLPPPHSSLMLPSSSSRGPMAPPHLRRNLPNPPTHHHDGGGSSSSNIGSMIMTTTTTTTGNNINPFGSLVVSMPARNFNLQLLLGDQNPIIDKPSGDQNPIIDKPSGSER